MVKIWGLNKYHASVLRGISSSGQASWPSSFGVTRPNSLAIHLSQNFSGEEDSENKKGLSSFIEMTSFFTTEKIPFLQSNTIKNSIKLSNFSQLKKNSLKNLVPNKIPNYRPISFIDLGSSIHDNDAISPIFQWTAPNPDFKFNGEEGNEVDTHDMDGIDKVMKLGSSFSFVMKIEMLKSNGNEQILFGYDGCGGLALICTANNEIALKVSCGEIEFRTGYVMPLNTAMWLAVNYDGSTLTFWVDDKVFNKVKKLLIYKSNREFHVGGNGEKGKGWNGAIYIFAVFDQVIWK